MTIDNTDRATVLVEALPYIRRFHGKRVVVKLGGHAMEQGKESTLLDIVLLKYVGMNPILVHGGGPEITALSERLGLPTEFRNGLRVTDARTMEVVKMVLTGKISPDLVASLNRLGAQAVGISGEDGPSVIAEPESAELGLVGRITQVNPGPIEALLEKGYIPVMASIGLGYDGNAYNINADTMAAELAIALRADKVILLTDVPGVKDSDGQVISEMNREQAARLVDTGLASGGMIPKLQACVSAVTAGAEAHIIDGRMPHALLLELFTDAGVGTKVVR